LLIPDFQGDATAIKTVVEVNPTVLGHNLETVLRLYPRVRPMANYQRSLDVLRIAKEYDSQLLTKSGLMLGLGETREEVIAVMRDLRQVDCDMLTLGQYLSPSSTNYPVVSFVTPQEFAEYIPIGLEMGFKGVASAPLMRSSFKADEQYKAVKISRGG
jgi:lipoic acid synthetase